MIRALAIAALAACHARPTPPPPDDPCRDARPVTLEVLPKELATAATPTSLALPRSVMPSILRSGASRLVYQLERCPGVPRQVKHSTGFPEVDAVLDEQLPELGIFEPETDCVLVELVLSNFDRACDPGKAR